MDLGFGVRGFGVWLMSDAECALQIGIYWNLIVLHLTLSLFLARARSLSLALARARARSLYRYLSALLSLSLYLLYRRNPDLLMREHGRCCYGRHVRGRYNHHVGGGGGWWWYQRVYLTNELLDVMGRLHVGIASDA